MEKNCPQKVFICRSPSDYEGGEIEVSEISGVFWDTVSGGVHKKNGSYSLYGYIDYGLAKKLVKCSGQHDFGWNQAKICIPKGKNNTPKYKSGYEILMNQAGEKPQSIISQNRPKGAAPCTKAILSILDKSDLNRGELREILLNMGYHGNTILNAIRSLTKQGKIITIGSSYSKYQILKLRRIEN
ncbi:hypothetical protein [Faecalicatena contorta]|uniref:hypothetical protein n=1 Tax=Faecalicatena contorta TaxID=39482 RepID=UPI001F2B71F3|nr:hypothetical protein [Faecalicatena contorta]MCF2554373.1 hypothetical protein [Faecalicatena contorta]